jgi:hypothetical protein
VARLALRDDAYYAPTDDGICVLTNSGRVVLTGPSIFQWVDRLAPYLDGRYTLAELTASMPAERRAMVERVVAALRDKQVVVEVGDDPEAHRDTAVVLVGSGPVLVAAAEAALCSGAWSVRVVLTGGRPADAALLDACERRHPDRSLVRVAADRLSDAMVDAGLVAAAGADADEVRALDRACIHAGIPFVATLLAGEEAWLGPFGDRQSWMSGWRRLRALGGYPDRDTADPAGAAPTVVANQLIGEAVRPRGGTVEPARMTRIDLRSLGTRRHGFLPHPYALAGTAPRPPGSERVDPEEFSRRVLACMDARLGVLGEVAEHDYAQIPLAVSQVQVSDPVLLLGPEVSIVVTGSGVTLTDARRAAALRGLATYGTLMVDPRRLHVPPGAADPRTGDPDEDLGTLRAGKWAGFLWGQRLSDGRSHELAATEVFPVLRGAGPEYLPPAGAAAGYDWAEAVRAGLVGRCRELTLAEGRQPFTPIGWDGIALDAAGERYRSMVGLIGDRLDVYDVTGSLRVPTLSFCLGGATVAYASGLSFPDALRDGLAEVLLRYQAETGYAPAPVPPLPMRERLSRVADCPHWTVDEDAVTTALARQGWTAVAVPLDHDPGVADVLPHLVNVVLTHG